MRIHNLTQSVMITIMIVRMVVRIKITLRMLLIPTHDMVESQEFDHDTDMDNDNGNAMIMRRLIRIRLMRIMMVITWLMMILIVIISKNNIQNGTHIGTNDCAATNAGKTNKISTDFNNTTKRNNTCYPE